MKLALLLVLALVGTATAGNRYALVLGNDAGDRDEQRLRYAELDADRLAASLVGVGGFASGDVVVVRGGDAEAARGALIALNARIRQAGGSDAMLIVYYSGHADSERLHLGASGLPLVQLEQLVRGSPAAFRMMIVDACRSGALTRVKGGTVDHDQRACRVRGDLLERDASARDRVRVPRVLAEEQSDRRTAAGDEIAETYTYSTDGTISVRIENVSRGYGRTFTIGALR